MIVIHETFVCKPGNASKLAKKFKEAFSVFPEVKQILTDMTGPFNKIVIVQEYDNLAAYEKSWEKYTQHSPEMKKIEETMAGYQDMYLTGSREIYKVW